MGTSPDVEEDCRSAPALTSNDHPTLIESTATTSISACSRKRKVDDEEAVECCPLPLKRRFESQLLLEELMAEEGKFLCWCSKWVSLRTDLEKSLEDWQRHLLTCQQSKAKGITSLADLLSAAVEILPSKMINGSRTSFNNQLKDETSASADASGSTPKKMDPPNAQGSVGVCCSGWEGFANALESGATVEALKRRKRPNRTEAERIQDFLDDPQVREVEPYRVLCCTCNKWIKLRNNSRYCSIPWKCHKSSCKKNIVPKECGDVTPSVGIPKHASSSKNEVIEPDSPSQSAVDFKVPPANTHPSLQIHPTASEQSPLDDKITPIPKVRRPRLADAENRKAVLEADPNAETVEPVLCALCKKWVKLRPNSTYCSAPWQSHIRRCVAKSEKKASKAALAVNSRRGGSSSKTSEGDSVTITPKRRRRPKDHAAQRQAGNGAESDNSYESEEQQ